MKLSSRGAAPPPPPGAPFAGLGSDVQFRAQGVWLGVSGRKAVADSLAFRLEWRHFFPSDEKPEVTRDHGPGIIGNQSAKGSYSLDILDGSAGLKVGCNLSVLGGLRYDKLDLTLSHPRPSNSGLLAGSGEEGSDLTVSAIKPYLGLEYVCGGPCTGVLIRAIGSPVTWNHIEWAGRNAQSGPNGVFLAPERTSGDSKYGLFSEITVQIGRKMSDRISVGAFGIMDALSAHAETDMKAQYTGNVNPPKYDIDVHRRVLILGGNAAVCFDSPF